MCQCTSPLKPFKAIRSCKVLHQLILLRFYVSNMCQRPCASLSELLDANCYLLYDMLAVISIANCCGVHVSF